MRTRTLRQKEGIKWMQQDIDVAIRCGMERAAKVHSYIKRLDKNQLDMLYSHLQFHSELQEIRDMSKELDNRSYNLFNDLTEFFKLDDGANI